MFSITETHVPASRDPGRNHTWGELSVRFAADPYITPASTHPTTKGQINETLVFREKQIYLLHLHISP